MKDTDVITVPVDVADGAVGTDGMWQVILFNCDLWFSATNARPACASRLL